MWIFCVPITCFKLIYYSSLVLFHFTWSCGKAIQIYFSCSLNKWKFSKWIELSQFYLSLSLSIHSGSSLGKMSKQFLYDFQYQHILTFSVICLGIIRLKQVTLILIQEFKWCKVERKPTEKQKFLFCCLYCRPFTHLYLQSHSVDLE